MDYKFNIKFLKGKEMYVTDFLSRHPKDGASESPNAIIPIAFLLKDATEEWDDTKPMTPKKLRLVNSHHCSKCDDGLFVITRSMAKTQGAEVPQMYPLRGDHNLPEVSKAGMIQTPKVAEQPVVKQPNELLQPAQTNPAPTIIEQQPQPQLQNVNRNVLTNFPKINPTLTYNQLARPIAPAQPMA